MTKAMIIFWVVSISFYILVTILDKMFSKKKKGKFNKKEYKRENVNIDNDISEKETYDNTAN